jgi:hypothetical protein
MMLHTTVGCPLLPKTVHARLVNSDDQAASRAEGLGSYTAAKVVFKDNHSKFMRKHKKEHRPTRNIQMIFRYTVANKTL